ncbi:MAG TPA: hypothetical protein VE684_06990 [Crenalkalicoccus sp.]|jgi:hypothetical protein|nr:hypothetical protein [Crenalkalicoccus sp.]
MRARATKHLKGNIWAWTGGLLLAGAAAAALGWVTPAAFLFMLAGIFIIMADSHVDPVAIITEDALHPDEAEVAEAPGHGASAVDRAVLALPAPFLGLLPAWSSLVT